MISRKIAAWLAIAASASPALAGSNLPLVTQSGQTRQLPSGTTLAVQPSTTGAASLNIPQGTAPTGPVNGDIWTTTAGVFSKNNGVVTGPLISRLDVRQFIPLGNAGVWGDGVIDDGPMIRAALSACAASGFRAVFLPQPPVAYLIKTLDTSGLGALVFGDGVNPSTCSVEGEAVNSWGDYNGGVNIKLDAGLNRPLIYIRTGAASPSLTNVRLDGNGSAQSGYTGDTTCGSKLYTICVQDGAASPEGSVRMRDSWLVSGYNGNLYVGSGRGSTNFYNVWSQYSGQSLSDSSIFLNGYDGEFFASQVGPNVGNGWYVGEGSQYQWHGGATFMNAGDGMVINGDKVNYLYISGMNFQYNGCNGLQDIGSSPFAGTQAGGHMIAVSTFDGNSRTTTNTCSDVYSNNTSRLNLISPNFLGNVVTADAKAKYNIQHSGTSLVRVTNPSFAATPNATAISNNYLATYCEGCNWVNTWTPTIAGSTTGGSVTYDTRSGWWSRHNNEVTVHFAIQWSAFSGAAGSMTITGLPYVATSTVGPGTCAFNNVYGWTGQANATVLTAVNGPASATLYLYEFGRALNAAQAAVSEFGGVGILQGTCTYFTDN